MRWYWYIFLPLVFAACQVVTIHERVVYEDGRPAAHAQVHQWNDSFEGYTFTDKNGEWKLEVPADTYIHLCIEPIEGYEACWKEINGQLLTPAENGEMEIIK